MSDIVKSILGRIKARKLSRLKRLKYLTREKMGWSRIPKIEGKRRVYRARRKLTIEDAKKQIGREAWGRLGGVTGHARATVPLAIAGTAYLAGRQEPKIRRRIRSRRQRRVSKRGIDPRLKRIARRSGRIGYEVGRPVAAAFLGYRYGIARQREKEKRSKRTRKASFNSAIDEVKKIIVGGN